MQTDDSVRHIRSGKYPVTSMAPGWEYNWILSSRRDFAYFHELAHAQNPILKSRLGRIIFSTIYHGLQSFPMIVGYGLASRTKSGKLAAVAAGIPAASILAEEARAWIIGNRLKKQIIGRGYTGREWAKAALYWSSYPIYMGFWGLLGAGLGMAAADSPHSRWPKGTLAAVAVGLPLARMLGVKLTIKRDPRASSDIGKIENVAGPLSAIIGGGLVLSS